MHALERIDEFGAAHAAAIVVGDSGEVLAMHGATDFGFSLASVTKLFTTMAILLAAEEGTLSLGDALGPPGSTVEHLLAHASGISPNDRRLALAEPGRRRIYSNAAFELAGEFLADRSRMSFQEYLRTGLFDPLQMTNSSCPGTPAAGGISTIGDIGCFLSELLTPTLLSTETMSVATKVAFPGLGGVLPGFGRQDPCDWGLGFEIKSSKRPHWTGSQNSTSSFGHFGQSGTFVLVDPEARYGLAVLTDRPFGKWAFESWPGLCDSVTSELSTDRHRDAS